MIEATVERRTFLTGCALLAGAAACSDSIVHVAGDADVPPDDASVPDDASTPDDSSVPRDASVGVDSAQPSSCPANAKDSGAAPSAVVQGKPVMVASIPAFVARDAGGLYSVSAVCTHQGCTINASGSGYSCPCHGATFDAAGTVTGGPAKSALVHYALCLTSGGKVAIDKSKTVPAATRFTL
jgi:hypothetical protein